ncbi:MAG: HXXEE domain-containing protein [bacterium]|nr:HXXEE domain-containing protein [bacterium]
MITQKLKNIFLLSTFLLILHGLEEIFTGFYKNDSHVAFIFGKLATLPTMQALFILFQIMLWLMLVISYLFLLGPKWHLRLMFIPGLVFVYELHHLYQALSVGGYYPGLLTAIPIYITGFFFWRELLKNYKSRNY